jgi:hypothetical protein
MSSKNKPRHFGTGLAPIGVGDRDLPTMKRPTIDKLFREAEEARFREALLESTGEELLDRDRAVSAAVEEQVGRLTAEEQARSAGLAACEGS